MATSPNATERKAALQKQIEALQKQMQEIDQAAIHELKLKLSDARQIVRELEGQLLKLTSEPATDTKPTPSRAKDRARRPSVSDDLLKEQLLKMMADFGQAGMNAKQMAERMDLDAIRVRRFIAAHPAVLRRQGAGPGTRFFLPE